MKTVLIVFLALFAGWLCLVLLATTINYFRWRKQMMSAYREGMRKAYLRELNPKWGSKN